MVTFARGSIDQRAAISRCRNLTAAKGVEQPDRSPMIMPGRQGPALLVARISRRCQAPDQLCAESSHPPGDPASSACLGKPRGGGALWNVMGMVVKSVVA